MAPKDRAEQMRQRLIAKSAERSKATSASVFSAPSPSTKILGQKSMAWFLWTLVALLLILGFITGQCMPLVICSILHTAYFSYFSTTDGAFQLRVVYSVFSGLGAFVISVRIVIYIPLLVNIAADQFTGYNVIERMLYCLRMNRPENPEPITLDFLKRVLKEPPPISSRPFSVKPGMGTTEEWNWRATTRTERRKVK